jgi:hypothetical protein
MLFEAIPYRLVNSPHFLRSTVSNLTHLFASGGWTRITLSCPSCSRSSPLRWSISGTSRLESPSLSSARARFLGSGVLPVRMSRSAGRFPALYARTPFLFCDLAASSTPHARRWRHAGTDAPQSAPGGYTRGVLDPPQSISRRRNPTPRGGEGNRARLGLHLRGREGISEFPPGRNEHRMGVGASACGEGPGTRAVGM